VSTYARMAEPARELVPPRRSEPLVRTRAETRAPSEHELDRVAARRTAGRNPLDEEGDVMSADAGVDAPTPAPPPTPAPATPAANCAVKSGPSYSVTGTVPVITSGGKKRAPFDFSASFTTDATKGAKPSCCEVRQYVKWDKKFHDWMKGPIHSGFPSTATYDTWYEDRDTSDTRYGHRSGPYSSPVAKCRDEYKTGTTQDMANGDTYCGHDGPNGPDTMTGTWSFQLKVVDTCDGDKEKASSAVITVNW